MRYTSTQAGKKVGPRRPGLGSRATKSVHPVNLRYRPWRTTLAARQAVRDRTLAAADGIAATNRNDTLSRRILEPLPTGVAVVDDEGPIRFTNRGWSEIGGPGPTTERNILAVNYSEANETVHDAGVATGPAALWRVIDGEQ
jgi:PAS domain-containing protein